jgi:short subunit dehydrogenase-like uncharacterized protein
MSDRFLLYGANGYTGSLIAHHCVQRGLVRRGGVLTPVQAAWKTRAIDFGQGEVLATTIPWGDVSTAFYSTGIPNIEVYMAVESQTYWAMVASRYLGGLLGLDVIQNFQKRLIQAGTLGPTEEERAQGKSRFWGEVLDPSGNRRVSLLQCPEGKVPQYCGNSIP